MPVTFGDRPAFREYRFARPRACPPCRRAGPERSARSRTTLEGLANASWLPIHRVSRLHASRVSASWRSGRYRFSTGPTYHPAGW